MVQPTTTNKDTILEGRALNFTSLNVSMIEDMVCWQREGERIEYSQREGERREEKLIRELKYSAMEDYIVSWVFTGVILWATGFLIIRKAFHHRSFDFCNRVVSTIHASLAVCLASLSVQDWSCPVCPLASHSSPSQMKTLAVSLSYLIYDSVCSVFDKEVDIDNLVHHIVCILGLGAGLAYERCGSEMVAALWITEMSSPFLHAREILKELGYRDTDLNLLVDIVFAVIFSLARMIAGPYLMYVTCSADNPLIIKAMAIGLQLVSAFWFYKIVRMVNHKIGKRMKASKDV